MRYIICSLPNASLEISGVPFELVSEEAGGPDPVRTVRSVEPVDAETAAQFEGIPGYSFELVGAPASGQPPSPGALVAEGEPTRRRGRPSKAELAARAAAALEGAVGGEAEVAEAEGEEAEGEAGEGEQTEGEAAAEAGQAEANEGAAESGEGEAAPEGEQPPADEA